jgi:PAS domain S-box-containing protein
MKKPFAIQLVLFSSIMVAAAIALTAFGLLRNINAESRRVDTFSAITNKTYALRILATSLNDASGGTDIHQAQEMLRSLKSTLQGLSSDTPRETVLLAHLQKNQHEADLLIDQWFASERAPSSIAKELRTLLVSQIWLKLQFISDDAQRLKDISQSRIVAAQSNTGTVIVALIIMLALTNGMIYWLSLRRVIQSQEALRLGEERLRAFLTHSATSGWLKDEHGRYVYLSPSRERLLRVQLEDWRGKTDFELFPREIAEEFRRNDQAVLASDGATEVIERMTMPDGANTWWLNNKFAFRDSSGRRYVGSLGVDITERTRAEHALREAQNRLESWNLELEQAVKLKTTELMQSQERLRALATELTLTEHRERTRLAVDLHDHLQQLLVLGKLKVGRGKKLASLPPAGAEVMQEIDDVLTSALVYTRTLVSELSPTVLREHGLMAGLRWLSDHMKRHALTVIVRSTESDEVNVPEHQALLVFQSVRELLMNVLKHAAVAEAEVILKRSPGALDIQVIDHGQGFNRTADGSSTSGISSKFGLFSIEERMRALGGTFEIQSAPGAGTKASITLPLDRKSEPSHEALRFNASSEPPTVCQRSPSTPSGKVQIILVDDHAMVRQGLKAVLDGYPDVEVVGEAGDGEEALAGVHRLRPDVVIMDINMPKKNGIEATGEMKTHFPSIIVIGLSVNVSGDNEQAMLKAGASRLLTKDAAVEQLHHVIQEEVARRLATSVLGTSGVIVPSS